MSATRTFRRLRLRKSTKSRPGWAMRSPRNPLKRPMTRSLQISLAPELVCALRFRARSGRARLGGRRAIVRAPGGGALRQRRLPGARRLLGRRSWGRREEGGAPAIVQGKRVLVLARDRSRSRRRFPSTFTIRKANWRSNPTAGRRAISPPRMSFRRTPAAILSSWRSNNRRKNGPTGRWFTDSANPRLARAS